MDSLAFHPIFSSPALALLLWGAVVFASFWIMRRNVPFSAGRRRILVLLRLFLLSIFAILVLRPVSVRQTEFQLPAAAAVLLDDSASMSIPDLQGQSRYSAAISAFQEGKTFSESGLFHYYRFDRALSPIPEGEEPPAAPLGDATALGSALDGLLDRYSGQRLLGVLVVSDGTECSRGGILPQEAALRYRNADVPLFTCCAGVPEGENLHDAAVEELAVPNRVYLGNEAAVTGFVHLSGYKGETFPLLFSVEGQEVQRCEMTPVSDDERIPYSFTYPCTESGQKRITVSIPEMPGEITAVNNASDAYIRGMKGNLRVLFLEGTRRFEDKFVRMALDAKQEIAVDYVRVPNEEIDADAHQYSVVIIGDVDPALLKPATLDALKKMADAGTGLIFLAGAESIAASKLGSSSLAAMLPVSLPGAKPDTAAPREGLASSVEEALRRDGEIRAEAEKKYIAGPVRVSPAEGAQAHYLARLASTGQESMKIWDDLPPLNSILDLNQFEAGFAGERTELREGSEILLKGTDEQGNVLPVLIAGSTASGRSALLLTDATWQWAMSRERSVFENFWRQLVLWTAGRDIPLPGELDLSVDSPVLLCGDTAALRIVYAPFQPENPDGIEIAVSVDKPDGTSEAVAVDEFYSGIFDGTDLPGEYCFRVLAAENGHKAEETCRFLVKEDNKELASPAAAAEVMRNLAEMTGGEPLAIGAAAAFYEKMREKGGGITDRVRQTLPLYDHWGIFLTGIALLTAEWLLRRKWGRA